MLELLKSLFAVNGINVDYAGGNTQRKSCWILFKELLQEKAKENS